MSIVESARRRAVVVQPDEGPSYWQPVPANGHADPTLGEAVDQLEEAGHRDLAERLRTELVGRNVLEGRWTFQVVEEYDDTYWSTFRAFEQEARESLTGGRRHLHEAGMKEDRRTHGHPDHTKEP